MENKINYKEFYDLVKDLDRKKFHFGACLDENGYVKNWSIYRKDMSVEEYYSAENKAVLSSEQNNIDDVINFIKEQKNV